MRFDLDKGLDRWLVPFALQALDDSIALAWTDVTEREPWPGSYPRWFPGAMAELRGYWSEKILRAAQRPQLESIPFDEFELSGELPGWDRVRS